MSQPRPSFLALLLILVCPALGFGAVYSATFTKSDGRIISGEWQKQAEHEIEKATPLRAGAVALWADIDYALFHQGKPGVLVGAQGWLFSREEFEQPSVHQMNQNIEITAGIAQRLTSKNIQLVITLIPDKSRIYPEHLGTLRRPSYLAGRYDTFRAALIERGIAAPDLARLYSELKTENAVFLRTDTHWSPYGATLSANVIAAALPIKGGDQFFREAQPELLHSGDLMKFLPLGYLGRYTEIKPEPLISIKTTALAQTGLLDDISPPGVLVGTSYSAIKLWDFEGALKAATGADILNVAEEGSGPFAPMQKYLTSESFILHPPQFIVWEIPERYVDDHEN